MLKTYPLEIFTVLCRSVVGGGFGALLNVFEPIIYQGVHMMQMYVLGAYVQYLVFGYVDRGK